MNSLRYALLLSGLLSGAAGAGTTANFTLTSDYLFRGITQTDGQPAVQGGIDFSAESGFYVGLWASNTDFDGTGSSGAEVDLYLGLARDIGEISIDLGVVTYQYPKLDDGIEEFYVGAGFGLLRTKYSYETDGDYWYLEAGLDFEVTEKLGLALDLGNFDADGGDSYLNYSATISSSWNNMDWSLMASDTDIEGDDLTVVVSVGAEFDL